LEDKFYVKALKFIDRFGDASDLAPRVAIYNRVLKESGDPALRLVIKSTQIESINNLIAPQLSLPPMSLTANIRYEKLASAFDNFQGYFAETKEQIKDAFQKALKETKRPSIINIAINPSADRKAQVIFRDLFFNLFSFFFNSITQKEFPWLTKSKI
jgi:hypothetical protein